MMPLGTHVQTGKCSTPSASPVLAIVLPTSSTFSVSLPLPLTVSGPWTLPRTPLLGSGGGMLPIFTVLTPPPVSDCHHGSDRHIGQADGVVVGAAVDVGYRCKDLTSDIDDAAEHARDLAEIALDDAVKRGE